MMIAWTWLLALALLPAAQALPAPEQARFETGVRQVERLWTSEDGSPEELKAFCAKNFFSGSERDALFERFEDKLEQLDGHFQAMSDSLTREFDEDRLPAHPVDGAFAAFSPDAHLSDDLFKSKLAFIALLNFPQKTLEECLEEGASWPRRRWAEVRLAQRFRARVPAPVLQDLAKAGSEAHEYVNRYNIHMDRVLGTDGKPAFRPGLKLLSHWGLRDELRALYADPAAALERQKLLSLVMERIITQQIPQAVVDNPGALWDPAAGTVDGKPSAREPDTRYAEWLKVFRARRRLDAYYPGFATHMDRSFKLERELPEAEVERILTDVLKSGSGKKTAALIRERLGRDLQPFDIWYDGFKPRAAISEEELDRLAAGKYPDSEAFQRDLPTILGKLGFDTQTAAYLASMIAVDPARGSGHAQQPALRGGQAHLRTRVPKGGMNYKGFNIAMHELGHNVEQVFSLNRVDHSLLRGVPNSAVTEGFAFVFQERDLEILGIQKGDKAADADKTLDRFWSLREIAGAALVEMRAWRWLYAHPEATPAQLREAVVSISKEVWNEYYAPVFGVRDSPLLAVYSHMIDYALYLPNYPLGYVIAYQMQDYFRTHPLGTEMERLCALGSLTPREWMRRAVGADVSPGPILQAADAALRKAAR